MYVRRSNGARISVKDPSHINAFILAYSKKLMNRCMSGFDAFTNWDKTFYYTDTDSMFIHNNQYTELKEKIPDIIGKKNEEKLGQVHDDIDEVEGGKIIRAVFIAPKLYGVEIIGKSKKEENRIDIANHFRAKGVPRESQKTLTIRKFQMMLENQEPQEFTGTRFAKSHKKTDEPAIDKIEVTKVINKKSWDGRIWEKETNRWIPISEEEENNPDNKEDE